MTDLGDVGARNHRLREWGESAPPIDAQLRDAAAWMLAAELVRRHPGRLVIDHAVPIEGVGYIGLGIYEAQPRSERRMVAFVPQTPEYHPTPFHDGPDVDDRPNWPQYVLSSDRYRILLDLERRARLDAPASTPSTTSATISYRVAGRFMERSALRSSLSKPRRWTFVQRSEISSSRLDPTGVDLDAIGKDERSLSAGYWCLLEVDGSAIAGIDDYDGIPAWLDPSPGGPVRNVRLMIHEQGYVILGSGERVDLMQEYDASGRRLDPIVNRLFPPIA